MDDEALQAIAVERAFVDFDPSQALDTLDMAGSSADASSHTVVRTDLRRKPRADRAIRFDSPSLQAERESADRAVIDRHAATRRLRRFSVVALLIAAAACWFGLPWARNAAKPPALTPVSRASLTTSSAGQRSVLLAKRIEDIDLGDRVAGTNPLREQVDLVTPDEQPGTRSISA